MYTPIPWSTAGVWKIEESEKALLAHFTDTAKYETYISRFANENRRLEWLATRVLLKSMLGEEVDIEYDADGAPGIAGSNIYVSLSHTRGYAAAAISRHGPTGIDIEYRSGRVLRIRSRFLHPDEEAFIDPLNEADHALVCWCAKEAMFKKNGKGGADFWNNFRLYPFPLKERGLIEGFCTSDSGQGLIRLHYLVNKYFVMTCCLDSSVVA
ncbi:MAG: 4'-phosphopantetheinyl transferase superfamily protein [Tannerellaceae bacterium]|nr:4'-phosphopantetheinyl transferase superfamily protein [Tannerellaceae bacterium]